MSVDSFEVLSEPLDPPPNIVNGLNDEAKDSLWSLYGVQCWFGRAPGRAGRVAGARKVLMASGKVDKIAEALRRAYDHMSGSSALPPAPPGAKEDRQRASEARDEKCPGIKSANNITYGNHRLLNMI